ncbi:GntR family transcriptional regulator [Pseudonocardia sp. H11422]|uniref:GntR family transcriptional regulator n=1 Tax=Pseudonocardia sp. H11422 TaxID=2835866 RepID=UPI002111F108|nr:GntR family transcriptional regulator [Pseudonocardia sp. H11422]
MQDSGDVDTGGAAVSGAKPGAEHDVDGVEAPSAVTSVKGKEAYQALHRGIQTGHYPAGMRLLEVKLADELGMSRTPVREAIRQLARDGIVEIVPNRGATVRGWTPAEVEEAYALRAVLEGFCASRAATRMDRAAVARLTELHAEFEHELGMEQPDVEALIRLNDQFHRAIVAGSGNAKAMEVVPHAAEVSRSIKRAFWSSHRIRQTALVYHREIVQAIRAGDPIRAEAVARSHVFSVKDFLFDYQRDVLDAGKVADLDT